MDKNSVTKPTLGRLPRYLNFLQQLPPDDKYVSATYIAKALKLGEVQVRKDLSAVSGIGKPRVGYLKSVLIDDIEVFLGFRDLTPAVLVGAGKLGKALLDYDDFHHYGVDIVAAFDNSFQAIRYGTKREILPMSDFGKICHMKKVQIGIITVGEGSAQEVADEMIRRGIKAIWNFAPIKLNVPDDVIVKQESLALSLAYLRNQLIN